MTAHQRDVLRRATTACGEKPSYYTRVPDSKFKARWDGVLNAAGVRPRFTAIGARLAAFLKAEGLRWWVSHART
jgi:hypothetical protein